MRMILSLLTALLIYSATAHGHDTVEEAKHAARRAGEVRAIRLVQTYILYWIITREGPQVADAIVSTAREHFDAHKKHAARTLPNIADPLILWNEGGERYFKELEDMIKGR